MAAIYIVLSQSESGGVVKYAGSSFKDAVSAFKDASVDAWTSIEMNVWMYGRQVDFTDVELEELEGDVDGLSVDGLSVVRSFA